MEKKEIGLVLQRIYDSEIHLRIGWLWDGGIDYSIGTTSNDLWGKHNKSEIIYTGEDRIEKAMDIICEDIVKKYPKSTFTKWFRTWKKRK